MLTIDGKPVSSELQIEANNSATEDVIATVADATRAQLDAAVTSA